MISYKVDDDARRFEFWSGGKDTVDAIRKYDEENDTSLEDTFYDMMDEYFGEDSSVTDVTDTTINDWAWFEVPELDEFACVFKEDD